VLLRSTSHPRSQLRLAAALVAAAGLLALLSGCRNRGDTTEAAPAALPLAERVAMSHVLVAFEGALEAPNGLGRSREDAQERARRIAVLLRSGRGDLPQMAQRFSDDPTAGRNAGYLGIFRLGEMEPGLEAAVCSLAVGQIGGPVETAHGFHVVRREAVQRLNIHHVLVTHRDAVLADEAVQRGRLEAARVATALRRKLAKHEADLCELAARFSDDDENRQHCGELGWVVPGMLEPDVEQAVFALHPGEVSEVVESEYGFHIFWRD